MPCDHCPVRRDAPRPCLGATHRPICDDIARGLPGRAAQVITLAEGESMPAGPPPIDPRLAMLADTCPAGAGCVCRARPCSAPDRPEVVEGHECRRCRAVAEWEQGVENVG